MRANPFQCEPLFFRRPAQYRFIRSETSFRCSALIVFRPRRGSRTGDSLPETSTASGSHARLNEKVERYATTGSAQSNVAKYYETIGSLKDPLVTLHTLAD